MRELTRSMARFSWAMSLFGIEQMTRLASPRRAADAFSAVARSAEGTLGPGLSSILQTGGRLQKTLGDLSGRHPATGGLGRPSPASGAAAGAPDFLAQVGNLAFELLQMGVNAIYQVTGTAWNQQQGLSGWGPVPPPGAPTQD
jgi:hypothetical protein